MSDLHLLYTDETNLDPATTEFFVYAGVAIPSDKAAPLSDDIELLRNRYDYRPTDLLKFNTVQRPSHITPDQHRDLKKEIVLAAAKHDVKLFSSFILHQIAKDPLEARRREINRISYHFDCYLRRQGTHGLILIDSFKGDDLHKLLREKFAIGVVGLPYSPRYRLAAILGVHLASIGTSHFCSLVDVVLGSLRFCINDRNDHLKQPVIHTLMQQLAPLFILSNGAVDEISMFFSPKSFHGGI